MKRRMKQKKYGILMFVGIAAMVLMQFAPCRAGWEHEDSDVSSGPTYGYNHEDGYEYELEEEFSVTNIDRGADSSGAWASADCEASAWVEVWSFEGGSLAKTAYAWCEAWGESNYKYDPDGPNDLPDPLYVDWELYASGTVWVEGGVDDGGLGSGDSANSNADADAGIDGEEDGSAWAAGDVSENENGSADVNVSGEAEEDYSSTTESDGYFYATLDFSVDAEDDEILEELWKYRANAEVWVSVRSRALVSVSQGYSGSAGGYGGSECSGDSDVEVSW